ncbi:hypothetical protein EMIT0111MI5_20251 [Burkholderia sp. IT-111MI5]
MSRSGNPKPMICPVSEESFDPMKPGLWYPHARYHAGSRAGTCAGRGGTGNTSFRKLKRRCARRFGLPAKIQSGN